LTAFETENTCLGTISFVVAGPHPAQKTLESGRFSYLQIVRRNQMKNLSTIEISVIKARILRGDKYSEIASDYRINQGRISDLKYGRIHSDIQAARLE